MSAIIFLAALAAPAAAACTGDVAVWQDNENFTRGVVAVSSLHKIRVSLMTYSMTGSPNATLQLVDRKLMSRFPALSPGCARCFGENIVCVYNKCLSHGCAINPRGAACLTCAREKCGAQFDQCSGLTDANSPAAPAPQEAPAEATEAETDEDAAEAPAAAEAAEVLIVIETAPDAVAGSD